MSGAKGGPGDMRIGIVGAGAIGSVVGGLLTKAGQDVTLLDQWPEHVEAMREHGLRLSGTCGEHVVKVKACHLHEAQAIEEPFDAVFVAVKADGPAGGENGKGAGRGRGESLVVARSFKK